MCLFKVTWKICEICSKLTIKTVELGWRCSLVFIINLEHISHIFLVFVFLTLNRQTVMSNGSSGFFKVTIYLIIDIFCISCGCLLNDVNNKEKQTPAYLANYVVHMFLMFFLWWRQDQFELNCKHAEAATGGVVKELEILQNSQVNTCARVSFLIVLVNKWTSYDKLNHSDQKFRQSLCFSGEVSSPCNRPKQSPAGFCKKEVLRNFSKFTGKHLCRSLF